MYRMIITIIWLDICSYLNCHFYLDRLDIIDYPDNPIPYIYINSVYIYIIYIYIIYISYIYIHIICICHRCIIYLYYIYISYVYNIYIYTYTSAAPKISAPARRAQRRAPPFVIGSRFSGPSKKWGS